VLFQPAGNFGIYKNRWSFNINLFIINGKKRQYQAEDQADTDPAASFL
jgi:hypothetical protein